MIKALFFDIDGTLVSFNTHTIPQSTLNAIAELRKKGIKLFISTGRPRVAIDNLGNLEFDGYITMNGSYCFGEITKPRRSFIYALAKTMRSFIKAPFRKAM